GLGVHVYRFVTFQRIGNGGAYPDEVPIEFEHGVGRNRADGNARLDQAAIEKKLSDEPTDRMANHDGVVELGDSLLHTLYHLFEAEVSKPSRRTRSQRRRQPFMIRPRRRETAIPPVAEESNPFVPAFRILKHPVDEY